MRVPGLLPTTSGARAGPRALSWVPVTKTVLNSTPPLFLAVTFLSDPYFDWLSLVGKLQNSCLNSEPKMT